MSLWKIAFRSIQQRSLASLLTSISMALGVTLVVAVLTIHAVVGDSFRNNAGLGYNMIVGAKGGKLQLVLNTVYYLSSPVENIPYSYYKEFTDGKFKLFTERAVPVCLGDYYQNYRVVGTTPGMFDYLQYGDGKKYAFSEGENFKHENYFDAVIGATVAKEANLKVGSKFNPTHGEGGHAHDPFTVVGVLAPTGTPNDRALFVNMEGFYMLSDHAKPVEKKPAEQTPADSPPSQTKTDDQSDHGKHEHADHDHADHAHDEHGHDETMETETGDLRQPAAEDSDHDHEHGHDEPSAKPAAAANKPAAIGDAVKPGDNHEHEHGDHDHADSDKQTDKEPADKEPADKDHSDCKPPAKDDHDHDAHNDAGHDHADHEGHDHEGHDHAHNHDPTPLPEEQREVTAILVRTVNDAYTPSLRTAINEGSVAQSVLPILEITRLFQSIVDPLQMVLLGLTITIVVVSGISILVSIYNSMSDRRHEIAVMRALGARRRTVMAIVLFESILLSLFGGILGWLLGHTLVAVLSPYIAAQTGVSLGFFQLLTYRWVIMDGTTTILIPYEVLIIVGLVALASLVGFLPAMAAYRTDVAKALSSTP